MLDLSKPLRFCALAEKFHIESASIVSIVFLIIVVYMFIVIIFL